MTNQTVYRIVMFDKNQAGDIMKDYVINEDTDPAILGEEIIRMSQDVSNNKSNF